MIHTLQQVPEFAHVPVQELKWIASRGTTQIYPDGTRVFSKGDVIQGFQIVLRGQIEIKLQRGGNLLSLGTYETGEILGKLPYSRMKAAAAQGMAQGETEVFSLHEQYFPEMISQCHQLTEALVHNMTDRARDFVKLQQQNDKMMALGKLSAGLAHELNNPSAAVIRSAQELKKHLGSLPDRFKRVIQIKTDEATVDRLNDLVFGKIRNATKTPRTMLQKAACEEDITTWLEAEGFDNSYELAETLAEFDVAPGELAELKSWLRPEDVYPVVNWVTQVLTTEKLVTEIEDASRRINALVTSIKGYTHMDQGTEKQAVDIHDGLRNTLTMLHHKIKKNSVRVVETFSTDLPRVAVYPAPLNQVWTNLIDNALDALEGIPAATITITTKRDREFVVVTITDNGPGIPADIIDQIFDPFFTTKPVGKGTGLGLEVVRQIVQQHTGKVEVKSAPGHTEFKICLPTSH
jgi:signal transduction histidine kinase